MTELTAEKQTHAERLIAVHQRLVEVYGEAKWRVPLEPVDELVDTILSQNTNDVNRDKAFDALKARFDSWEVVRDCPLEDLVETIRIAGLANQKGANIQNALRVITEVNGEISLDFLYEMPESEARAWLTDLKGVGPKTAAIVLLFSMGIPAFPVDTHIFRVSGRLGVRPMSLDRVKTHAYLEEIAPPETFKALHINLISLGREVCQARKIYCGSCYVADICTYAEKDTSVFLS